MDRLIGVPNIQVRLKRAKRLRIVANRSYDDAGLARSTQRRLLYPIPNAAAHGAFIVEKEARLCLVLHLGPHFTIRTAASLLRGCSLWWAAVPRIVRPLFLAET